MKLFKRLLFPRLIWKLGSLIGTLIGIDLSLNFYPVTDVAMFQRGAGTVKVVYEDSSIPSKRVTKIKKLYIDFGDGPERFTYPVLIGGRDISSMDGKTADIAWVYRRQSLFGRDSPGKRIMSMKFDSKEIVDEKLTTAGFYESFEYALAFTFFWIAFYMWLYVFGNRAHPQLISTGAKP